MAEVAMMHPRPFPNPNGISTTHRDVTDSRYRDLRRPRKVRFFANGNRYFKGRRLFITPHRYITFNDLLNDLTTKFPSNVRLPYGVRGIYTPAGKKVYDIDQLEDGSSYVCTGFETFKALDYGSEELQPWTNAAERAHNHDPFEFNPKRSYNSGYNNHNSFQPSKPLRHSYPTIQQRTEPSRKQWGTFGARAGPTSYWNGPSSEQGGHLSKPKVVTVLRNTGKPRPNVKILLNRRSVQSYEQLIKDISEAFGPKWRNNKVRKLFSLRGREAQGVSDFFRDDEVFIAVGNEPLTTGDVQDILEEMYPDSPYAKNLLKEWDKTKRSYQPAYGNVDSGLGSDGSKNDEDDIIYRGRGGERPYRKKKQKQQPQPQPSDEDMQYRIAEERMRAAEDERERARRRMQKRLDAERRSYDEERRKKGYIPLKPIEDSSPSPRRKKKTPREGSSDEPKVIVVLKDTDEDGRSPGVSPARTPRRKDDDEDDGNGRKSKAKKHGDDNDDDKSHKSRKKRDGADDGDKDDGDENRKNRRKKPEGDDNDNERNRRKKTDPDKENDDPNKGKKKGKRGLIYKTKAERQTSNAEHVKDKYEPGKQLGDGNFAVVKQCRLKNTNNDYAMKIVDKAKLKGKDQMIENEIEIMKHCNHPNITKLMEEFETKDEYYLIMELVKGGDLFDAITQSVKFNEEHSARMVSDLAQALFYLHSREIVHRDMKPENLLVQRNKDSSITLKLADFGLAMEVTEPIYTVCGTPTYVAPEILAETGYGLEVDLWALGVITYILLCGFPPFRSPDRKQTELFEFIKAGEYEFLSPYWDKISRQAKDLIKKLLVVNKGKRYTSIDVLCHPWVITAAGTAADAPEDMEAYRTNLRQELKDKAKSEMEAYKKEKQQRQDEQGQQS